MSRAFLEFTLAESERHGFAVNTGERTITGLMVPWGKSARSNGKRWRFARGSIKWGHLNRIKLLRDHDNASALGKCVAIEDTDCGLVGTFKISAGPRGDEALALAADEVLDGLSIGAEWREDDFGPDPLDSGGYLVFQSALRECSLTAMPSFDDSRLTSVRASDEGEDPGMPEQQNREQAPANQPVSPAPQTNTATAASAPQELPRPATPTPEQAAAQQSGQDGQDGEERTFSVRDIQQLFAAIGSSPAALGGTMPLTPEAPAVVNPVAHATPPSSSTGATFVREALPYRFTHQPQRGAEPGGRHIFHSVDPSRGEHDFSTDVFSAIDTNGADRDAVNRVNAFIHAAFAVAGSDMAGVIPARQAPELWQPQMDYATPLWDMINSGSTDGEPFILPKFNSASGLVVAATAGTEPAPGAMTVTTQTVTPTQLWGKVEIERQAIRRGGNPQISGIIWDQMLREYYEDREAAVATFLNTLTAATDIALTGPSGAPDNTEDLVAARELEAAIAGLQFVRGGNRFRAFAAHEAVYRLLARVEDGNGRPRYPQINPMNSNGQTSQLYTTITIAGVTAVPAWALGAAGGNATVNSWLFDPAKVRGWANSPERLDWNFGATVQSNNATQLAYVTMGIYGDLALANLDINGVRQITFDQNTAA